MRYRLCSIIGLLLPSKCTRGPCTTCQGPAGPAGRPLPAPCAASPGPRQGSARTSRALLPRIKRYSNTSQSHGISHVHDTYRESTCVCKHTISEYMYIRTLLSVRLLDTITLPFYLYIFTYCLPKLTFLLYGPFPFILPLSCDLKGIKPSSSSNPALKWSGTFPLTAHIPST